MVAEVLAVEVVVKEAAAAEAVAAVAVEVVEVGAVEAVEAFHSQDQLRPVLEVETGMGALKASHLQSSMVISA